MMKKQTIIGIIVFMTILSGVFTIATVNLGVSNKDTTLTLNDDDLTSIDGFKGFDKTSFENTLKNYYECECAEEDKGSCINWTGCKCYVSSSWHHNVEVNSFQHDTAENMNTWCDDASEKYLQGWLEVEKKRMNPTQKVKIAEGDISLQNG